MTMSDYEPTVDTNSEQGLIQIAKRPDINEGLLQINQFTTREFLDGFDPSFSTITLRTNHIISNLKSTLAGIEQVEFANKDEGQRIKTLLGDPMPAISFFEGTANDGQTTSLALAYFLKKIEENNKILTEREKTGSTGGYLSSETQDLCFAAALIVKKRLEQGYLWGKEEKTIQLTGSPQESEISKIARGFEEQDIPSQQKDPEKVKELAKKLVDLLNPHLPSPGMVDEMVSELSLSYRIPGDSVIYEYRLRIQNPNALGIANKVLNIDLGTYQVTGPKSQAPIETLIHQITVLPDYTVRSALDHEKKVPELNVTPSKDFTSPQLLFDEEKTIPTTAEKAPASAELVKSGGIIAPDEKIAPAITEKTSVLEAKKPEVKPEGSQLPTGGDFSGKSSSFSDWFAKLEKPAATESEITPSVTVVPTVQEKLNLSPEEASKLLINEDDVLKQRWDNLESEYKPTGMSFGAFQGTIGRILQGKTGVTEAVMEDLELSSEAAEKLEARFANVASSLLPKS